MAPWKINFLSIEELKNIAGIGQTIALRIAKLRKAMGYKLTADSLAAARIRIRSRAKDDCDFTPFNGDAAVIFAGENLSDDDDEEEEEKIKHKLTPIPKSLIFSGKENWNCFKTKFSTFISHQNCCDETKLVYLSLALEDGASVFYEKKNERKNFTKLSSALRELESRFENPDGENAAMMQLRSTVQLEGEKGREYEDRLFEIAYRAYPDRKFEDIEKEVLCQFQLGLFDLKARKYLTLNEPRNLQTAHDLITKLSYSRQACQKHKKFPSVRKVIKESDSSDSSSDNCSESEENETMSARQIQKPPHKKHFIASKEGNAIDRMGNQMSEMCESIKQMSQQIRTLCSSRSSSGNRSFSRSMSPASRERNVTCEVCLEKGHYSRKCVEYKDWLAQKHAAAKPKIEKDPNA